MKHGQMQVYAGWYDLSNKKVFFYLKKMNLPNRLHRFMTNRPI